MLVDQELVQRAASGDSVAFNELVTAYRRRVLGTVARLIGRPEDVEDVAQEVFVRLYFSLDQLRTPEGFESWLYRLTVNAALDYLRKRKRKGEARMADLSLEQVTMADARASHEVQHELDRKIKIREFVDYLLGSISHEDRTLLTLKEVEGLSLKELESVYRVNENALKVRLYRARQRVLKALAANQAKQTGRPADSEKPG